MDLKSKLNNLKESLDKNVQKVKEADISDATKLYKGILKRLPDISHLKNIVLFSGAATLLIFILFAQRFSALSDYLPTSPLPGGTYTEGMVGKIEQLNPLFSSVNSSEEAATSLIFSGLTKKAENRNVVPDLAEKWDISADGKTYTFYLKKNINWQDGKKLNADDVIFTIKTIQNPDSRSPLLEVWKGIDVSKTDDQTVVFKLQNPYSGFIYNTDLSIIPKHILESIPARNLKTTEFNTNPIGTGPFKFKELKSVKDTTELSLLANSTYYAKKPYLEEVILKTYPDYSRLTTAYTKKEVLGIEKLLVSELDKKNLLPNIQIYGLSIPEYDAIYFNLKGAITKEKVVREAISAAINRAVIVDKSYKDEAIAIYEPLLPGYVGYNPKLKPAFDPTAAKNKLIEAGYTPDTDGILKKGDSRLTLRLVTANDPAQEDTAEIIQEQLKNTGIELQVEKYPLATFLQDYARSRNYDMILVSQNLGADSDIYSFWHSTQANDPGLNFSGYSDRRLDKLLEQGRSTLDPKVQADKYSQASQIIASEVPAIYLVWPNYIYGVSREVKGIKSARLVDPKDRFSNIENWYINEKKAE